MWSSKLFRLLLYFSEDGLETRGQNSLFSLSLTPNINLLMFCSISLSF